jgi:hypothetical protein
MFDVSGGMRFLAREYKPKRLLGFDYARWQRIEMGGRYRQVKTLSCKSLAKWE